MVMKYVNWALRRQGEESDVPRCSDHKVEMRLRGVGTRRSGHDLLEEILRAIALRRIGTAAERSGVCGHERRARAALLGR